MLNTDYVQLVAYSHDLTIRRLRQENEQLRHEKAELIAQVERLQTIKRQQEDMLKQATGQAKPAPTFAVGQRVRVKESYFSLLIGQAGTITHIEESHERGANIKVRLDFDPYPAQVKGDPERLHIFWFTTNELEAIGYIQIEAQS